MDCGLGRGSTEMPESAWFSREWLAWGRGRACSHRDPRDCHLLGVAQCQARSSEGRITVSFTTASTLWTFQAR